MDELPAIPYVDDENKSVLWNNLPYCGLYNEPPFEGTYTNLDTPSSLVVNLIGRPLPLINGGVNKNLRLIGFDKTSADKPVTPIEPWRLITYSPWLEYRVKWSTTSRCRIGFYTTNYVSDPDPYLAGRRTILIGENGPCLFEGNKGTFYLTGITEFYVITDKDVTVKLQVKCRSPCEITFSKLKLYKPLPYRLEDDCVFAYETKITDFSGNISFVPTKKYIRLTADIRKYIMDTSILLDFSPVLQRQKLVSATSPLTLRNLPCILASSSTSFTSSSFTYYVDFSSVNVPEYSVVKTPTPINGLKFIEVTTGEQPIVSVKYTLQLAAVGPDSESIISNRIEHLLPNGNFQKSSVRDPRQLDKITDPLTMDLQFERNTGHFFLSFWLNFLNGETLTSITITELIISYQNEL